MDWTKVPAPAATLYRAAISLGAQEAQLIWTRYTGFIVMNGLLVSVLSNKDIREQTTILAALGFIALVLNCIWHVLNYAGWQNQHLFYRQAGNLFDSDIGLLTDCFRTKDFKPGWIYWLAQTIPIIFSLIAIPCVSIAASSVAFAGGLVEYKLIAIAAPWVIGAVLWLAFAGGVLLVEYKLARQAVIEPA
jgi:hypothetical protein